MSQSSPYLLRFTSPFVGSLPSADCKPGLYHEAQRRLEALSAVSKLSTAIVRACPASIRRVSRASSIGLACATDLPGILHSAFCPLPSLRVA
jgi:hypothetical protein